MAAEFSFDTLEAPPEVLPPSGADAVLDALAAAEAKAQAVLASAREEGHEQGLAEARAAAEPALRALAEAVEGMRSEAAARADRLESQAVDLALFLAERVLGGALDVQPERVLEAVRGALRGIVERDRVTVLVHPDDLALVREGVEEVRASLGGIEHCEVQAERRVARGGAIVRTVDGDIDARVETKLARAREVVGTLLAREPAEAPAL